MGYKVDTSLTPHIKWNDKTRENAVDYTNMPEQPFTVGDDLLEVPISIFKSYQFSFFELLKSGFGLRRDMNFTKNIWLRPVYSDFKKMEYIFNNIFKKYNYKNIIVFNMMFHNVEIIPLLSPYTKNELDCVNYLNVLTQFFNLCLNNGSEFVSLSRLYEIYNKQKNN